MLSTKFLSQKADDCGRPQRRDVAGGRRGRRAIEASPRSSQACTSTAATATTEAVHG